MGGDDVDNVEIDEMSNEGRTRKKGKVLVLMATYNAGRFIKKQIASLAEQSWPHIDILVSDDGSIDGTVPYLQAAAGAWRKGTFSLIFGPQKGFAENFRSLMSRIDGEARYIAFCDQDDIWDRDKLDRAIAWLDAQDSDRPALFCGRTRLVDEEGNSIGLSPLFEKPASFRNALVQSIAGGNTMVLNRAGAILVAEAARRVSFISHDWWCYMLLSGAGGAVHYSPSPSIAYRQHGGNLVGANTGWKARLHRLLALMFTPRFSDWNRINLSALERVADLLTPDAISVLRDFEQARTLPLPARFCALKRSGVYRQTAAGQLGLWLACALRRL